LVTAVFNLVVPILAGVCFIAALYFAGQAFSARSRSSAQPYDVGRQIVRQSMLVNILRSLGAVLVGLILLGVMGLRPLAFEPAPQSTPSALPTESLTAVPAPTVAPTLSVPTVAVSPTARLPSPTPTPLPSPTPTPAPQTARVSSEVGVWLRSAPGIDSEQLQWLLEGTLLIVLEGRETADNLEWQQVQLTNGVEGWVAAEFITLNVQP
jgi:hypothetical protein